MSGIFNDRQAADQFLFLPSRAGGAALEEFKRRNSSPLKFGWGEPDLDDYLVPMVPGDLTALIARPGHGKTSAMIHLARVANEILSNKDDNGFVFYVTWETMVEEFVAIQNAHVSQVTLRDIGMGHANLDRLESAVAQSINQRIAVVGMSLSDQDEDHSAGRGPRRMPTLDDVDQVLTEARQELGIIPRLVLLDYLQRIPSRQPGKDRSIIVSENLDRCKDIGLAHKVPVVVAVQAKRDVDELKGLKLASMSDGQWTSNIEQTCDKVLSHTRPILYMPEGTAIEDPRLASATEGGYTVSSRTFVISVVKQRWAEAGKTFLVDLNPASCEIRTASRLEVAF